MLLVRVFLNAVVSSARDEKIAIMRDKYSALMRPVVFALDHVCSITVVRAETPHETWFQQTYGTAIVAAMERLRNPSNPANPASSWVPFKHVGPPPGSSHVLLLL